MKKQKKQQEIIDLDNFDDDISLWQMIPCGKGMGLSHLKVIVDSVLNGQARLNSLVIVGKEGLTTHSFAFLRAIGSEIVNQVDGSLIHHTSGTHQFFCTENYDGYIISNVDKISSDVKGHLFTILSQKHFTPYNYLQKGMDLFEIPQPVIMTSKDLKRIPEPILKNVQHVVKLEDYDSEQRILIILQRLKYAHVEYENDAVLSDIAKYGNLKQCIRFLKCSVAIMQSQDRQILMGKDVQRASRLSYSVPAPPMEDKPY